MTPQPHDDWPKNYFNYFTEVEEHFQRARGTSLFLMSPLDWALVEAWKNSGVPLEAVLRGIDVAFEKWRAKKSKTPNVNGIAYCTQAVMEEAKIITSAAAGSATAHEPPPAPFEIGEVREFLQTNSADLRARGFEEVAVTLDRLAADVEVHYKDLEELEQRLSALEEKLGAILRTRQTDEQLFQARRDLDSAMRPYRGKMTADQISMLEKQYMERRLFEAARLPRLSLFYLVK